MNETVINGDLGFNPLLILKNEAAPSTQPISEKVIDNELIIAKKMYHKLVSNEVKYISSYQHKRFNHNEETNALFILIECT